MTKSEIVNAVYTRVGGFSKKEAADIVDLIFETLKETLGRGEKVKVSGFGNFVLRDKRQRRGRNPRTGEPLTIVGRRVLTFKASQVLKSLLNPEIELAPPPRNGSRPVPVAAAGPASHVDSRRAAPSSTRGSERARSTNTAMRESTD